MKTISKITVQQKSTVKEIIDYFKKQIRLGEIKIGDRLLPERDLAKHLGVSRTSLREALITLNNYGIVEVRPSQGTFVKRPDFETLYDFFGLAFLLEPAISENIREIRMILECEAARLASRRISKEELAELKNSLKIMHEKGPEADFNFHRLIIYATHNKGLIFIYKAIEELLYEYHKKVRVNLFQLEDVLNKLIESHYDIYHAIHNGDPDQAEKKMREHFFLAETITDKYF